jgi:hypothetical protein
MSLEWCRDCKEMKFDRHQCDPGWLVWSPEDGETEDDARTFYGMSAERAVEKWAAWSDSNSADYAIVGGSEVTVHVRLRGLEKERAGYLMLPTEELVFEVYGESVPSYSAVLSRKKVAPAKGEDNA